MKPKALILILLGTLGIIFVCTFDIISGKPINDFTGPKSTPTLITCAILIIAGIMFLLKGSKKKT